MKIKLPLKVKLNLIWLDVKNYFRLLVKHKLKQSRKVKLFLKDLIALCNYKNFNEVLLGIGFKKVEDTENINLENVIMSDEFANVRKETYNNILEFCLCENLKGYENKFVLIISNAVIEYKKIVDIDVLGYYTFDKKLSKLPLLFKSI